MKLVSLIAIGMLFSASAMAGTKDDFIAEVKKQCGKDDGAAAALATGGRQGNVMKWKTCTSATVTVGDCTLTCTDSSSKIGG
ncbi:MAG: hypothetical protein CME64_12810 [Halobacteriovoraceae bacterium]|nr:hypothetical protein [Halobacteriovoraceae bacterium]